MVPDGITMTPVNSSMVTEVGYDAANMHLYVTFKGSSKKGPETWRYDGVTPAVHAALVGSCSVGRFFLSNVKGNYTSHKL